MLLKMISLKRFPDVKVRPMIKPPRLMRPLKKAGTASVPLANTKTGKIDAGEVPLFTLVAEEDEEELTLT